MYDLQSFQQVWGKMTTDICQTCGAESDIRAFLLKFSLEYKEMYIKQIKFIIPFLCLQARTDQDTQLLLHPSHPIFTSLIDLAPKIPDGTDYIFNICYKLDTFRAQYLIYRMQLTKTCKQCF